MIIPTVEPPAAPALRSAVDAVELAVEDLIKLVGDGHVRDLGAFELVATLQAVQRVVNKLPVVDRALIQHGTEQGVPGVVSERSMTRVLMNGLRISVGAASRRVRAAEHLADRTSMTGEPLSPVRPHLAAAQRDGSVTPEQVTVIDAALRKVKHCDPAAVEAGEVLLVEQAGRLGHHDLEVVAAKLVDAIDPDGVAPTDEAEHRLRRFFHLKHRGDGSWTGDFRLTPEVGQKLAALLGPLTKPQTTRFTTADGTTPDSTTSDGAGTKHVEADERTQGQRRHDALAAVLDAALRTDDLPGAGGVPTTVVLTMSWEDYVSPHGIGRYGDGSLVSARTARALADQAEVAFCLTTAQGAVLELYRSRRIASPAQTLALIARDGGCTFPGCDVAPQWCERHHVVAWHDGGPTNLANLTLVCAFHHHQFERRGWQCRINSDGLPVWIPPRWIDPDQRPILNARLIINRWDPQDPLVFDDDSSPPDPPPSG